MRVSARSAEKRERRDAQLDARGMSLSESELPSSRAMWPAPPCGDFTV